MFIELPPLDLAPSSASAHSPLDATERPTTLTVARPGRRGSPSGSARLNSGTSARASVRVPLRAVPDPVLTFTTGAEDRP